MPTAPLPAGPARPLPSGTGWPAPVTPIGSAATRAAASRLQPGPSIPAPDHAAGERAGAWLRAAAAGLVLLAGAAAAVSFSAQYRMTDAARRLPAVAGLEAAIPDAAALVFACLGIAMALHGRHAARARFLNLAAVGTSVFMNAIAAEPGWRGLAIWVMPPVAYALASDTLIGVVRAHALASGRGHPAGTAEETTPLAALARLLLWLARLLLAPASTCAGLRAGVLAACPVPPRTATIAPDTRGRTRGPNHERACPPRPGPRPAAGDPHHGTPQPGAPPAARPAGQALTSGPAGTNTARVLALAECEHGPLAAVPLADVGRISAALAPLAGLHPGSARTALRRAIRTARDGSPS